MGMITIFFQTFSASATMKIFVLNIMLLFVFEINALPSISKYGINRFDQDIDPIDASIDPIDFEIAVNQIDMGSPADKIDAGNPIDRLDPCEGLIQGPGVVMLKFDQPCKPMPIYGPKHHPRPRIDAGKCLRQFGIFNQSRILNFITLINRLLINLYFPFFFRG